MFDTLGLSLDIWSELRSILEDQNITKVMHDCRQDSAALLYQEQLPLQNVFDTQVKSLSHAWQLQKLRNQIASPKGGSSGVTLTLATEPQHML